MRNRSRYIRRVRSINHIEYMHYKHFIALLDEIIRTDGAVRLAHNPNTLTGWTIVNPYQNSDGEPDDA